MPNLSRSKIFFLIFGLIIIALGFWWWQGRATAKKSADPKQSYTVTYKPLKQTLNLSGSLQFDKEANLRFQTSGLLVWVGVKPGQKVKKGQTIASLDRRQLYKRLKKALNSYYKTRLDFEDTQDEYKDILDKTPQIQRILERSQKDLDNAVLDVELQHLAWQLAVIHAPFDGVIDSMTVPVAGTNITPSQATFHIVDPNSLFFQAEIDEMDLPYIKPNQKVTVNLDAYPDLSLTGQIQYVSLSATTGKGGSRVYLAKISLDQNSLASLHKQHIIPSDLNGQAILTINSKDKALVVPVDLVYYQKGKPYVLLQKANGQVVKQFVQTGLETTDYIEITSGLNVNDVIVSR